VIQHLARRHNLSGWAISTGATTVIVRNNCQVSLGTSSVDVDPPAGLGDLIFPFLSAKRALQIWLNPGQPLAEPLACTGSVIQCSPTCLRGVPCSYLSLPTHLHGAADAPAAACNARAFPAQCCQALWMLTQPWLHWTSLFAALGLVDLDAAADGLPTERAAVVGV
jgi:hypothetical protein